MELSLAFFAGDGGRPDPLALYMQAAIWADRAGLAAIWTPERHFHPFGGAFPDPAVASAAVAACTSRIALRAGSVVSPLHDIAEVVERWTMVDNISGGRVGLAFASGWRAEDFVLRPDAYLQRGDLMWRQISEARQLWSGATADRIGWDGRVIAVPLYPRPCRSDLPVWVATSGSSRTVQRAAEVAAGIFTHLVSQSVEELRASIRDYRQQLPPGVRGHVALMLHTFIGSSDEEAREVAREPLRRYLDHWLDLSASGPGGGVKNRELMLRIGTERYLRGRSLVGSVETCAGMLRDLAALGVDEVACLVDFGVADAMVLDHLPKLNQVLQAIEPVLV